MEAKSRKIIYIGILALVWACAYIYTFNEKIDINGDNCRYYTLATALATGEGYADISAPTIHPVNTFPPGYPLLMAPLRFITDSVVAQKILNGLFLLAGTLLLFFIMLRGGLPDSLALVCGCAAVLSARVLHFSTMMMSEMSFFLTSAAVLFFLARMKGDEKPFYKDLSFYGMAATLVYCYHIRTQGVALFAAVVLALLIVGKWKEALGTAAAFIAGCLPWIIRNKALGVEQSRYFESIAQVNPWRPEDGTLDIGGIVSRFFETLGMLVSKALPNSVIPYIQVNYSSDIPAGIGLWLLAVVMIALIVRGFWSFKRLRWALIGYTAFTFGMISIFSTPSENRYITALIPFLNMGLLTGVYVVADWCWKRLKLKNTFPPLILALLLLTGIGNIRDLHAANKRPFPPQYQNYFKLGEVLRQNVPAETVVAARKGELLYMFSGTRVTGYAYSQDDREVIQKMLDDGVEYVILDQLGYSSTARYLYPAIQQNPHLFVPVSHIPNPDTYLLRFNREAAREKLSQP